MLLNKYFEYSKIFSYDKFGILLILELSAYNMIK